MTAAKKYISPPSGFELCTSYFRDDLEFHLSPILLSLADYARLLFINRALLGPPLLHPSGSPDEQPLDITCFTPAFVQAFSPPFLPPFFSPK